MFYKINSHEMRREKLVREANHVSYMKYAAYQK